MTEGVDLQEILNELWQEDVHGLGNLLQKVQYGSLPAWSMLIWAGNKYPYIEDNRNAP